MAVPYHEMFSECHALIQVEDTSTIHVSYKKQRLRNKNSVCTGDSCYGVNTSHAKNERNLETVWYKTFDNSVQAVFQDVHG